MVYGFGSGFLVNGSWFRDNGFYGLWFMVYGVECRASGLGFRVYSSWLMICG
jgi:hypothetical protein